MKIESILLTALTILVLTSVAVAQVPKKITCFEKESKNKAGVDPVLTKTCFYKNYKTILKGYPDYKGRYSYVYSVFKKQKTEAMFKLNSPCFLMKIKMNCFQLLILKLKRIISHTLFIQKQKIVLKAYHLNHLTLIN